MFTTALFSTAVACGLLSSAVNAHMTLRSPTPYGQNSLNNSPLENDGSDFPCKQRPGVYDITEMNEMPVGVPQELSFSGGATHGGGSCQVSVTLDQQPTKQSDWRVIHSIVGGCPSNSSNNLSGDPNDAGSSVFQFSIPQGMPNGQYTLAWTWFNKIGNREIYMNCAPIEVTGGADNNDVYDTLPNMFVINLPREECRNTEMEDMIFPDPGRYAETPFKTALGSSTSGSGCARVTAMGAGSVGASQPSSYAGGSSAQDSIPTPAPTNYAPAPSYSAPDSVQEETSALQDPGMVSRTSMVAITSMLTVTATGSAPEQTQIEWSPPVASAYSPGNSANVGSDSKSETGSNDTTGSCTGNNVACSNDGSVVCIGSDQWGLCNAGCAFPMALAEGTSCSAGTISRRHAAGRHLHRHVQHMRKH